MSPLAALAGPVAALLVQRRQTVAVAESSAGGLVSAALLAVPGASAYYLGGSVIYTQAARRRVLRVPDDAVRQVRSSTEAYALLKARAVREQLGATWGLAETGAAGPTGNRYGDPPGRTTVASARSAVPAPDAVPTSSPRVVCTSCDALQTWYSGASPNSMLGLTPSRSQNRVRAWKITRVSW